MKNLILASTSTVHGSEYLEYLQPVLRHHFKDISELLFIPYARPGGCTHEAYTAVVRAAFAPLNISVSGIHEHSDAQEAIDTAQGIFVGGGNTFVLVKQLYEHALMAALNRAIQKGTPYLGTSAGSNICGVSMQTTNDMPIVAVPNYKTLACIPFNINAHYLDPDPESTHKGETREERIKEFHTYNDIPVVGLREGSWLKIENNSIELKGPNTMRLFSKDKPAVEIESGTLLSSIS